jgi:ketosteroid isomerase-like protein
MDAESAEILRRFMDAWNRRDVEGIVALSDPEIEYVNAPSAVEPGTRRGHEGIRSVVAKQWDLLGDAQVELEWIREHEDGIIGSTRITRGMPDSRATIEVRGLVLWTIRDGRVARFEVLGAGTEFDRAVKEAGIVEPGG